jgi:hypothetical protein
MRGIRVGHFARGAGVPGMQARNLKAVPTTFEIHGIEFIDQTGFRFRGG